MDKVLGKKNMLTSSAPRLLPHLPKFRFQIAAVGRIINFLKKVKDKKVLV